MNTIIACGNCHTPKDANGLPILFRALYTPTFQRRRSDPYDFGTNMLNIVVSTAEVLQWPPSTTA
jgi:hypothetical protein